jgi:hypothetical protein
MMRTSVQVDRLLRQTDIRRAYSAAVDPSELYDVNLDPDELAWHRVYGPWRPLDVDEARSLLDPLGIEWWIVGGWAIEAFTRVARHHEDIDITLWLDDLPALHGGLRGRFYLFGAGPNGIRVIDDEHPDLPPDASQVWIREHALAPWRADFLLNERRDGRWVSRRDETWTEDFADVVWVKDGVRFMKPHIVLAHKARANRPKDVRDLEVTLPLLDESDVVWLDGWLAAHAPEHPWRERLRDSPPSS